LVHFISGATADRSTARIHPVGATIIDPTDQITVGTCCRTGAGNGTGAGRVLTMDTYSADRALMDAHVIGIRN
jgi:hypothetical protein